jgi:16S rRNA (guanine527-N7)-methyltransferase
MTLEREEFKKLTNVSRETFLKFEQYEKLLIEWNEKFNLVGESTLSQIWKRHFLDSAQLMNYIPAESKTLIDLGSGAGFPGLVLSLLGLPEVHLVESIGKKANFLRAVANELQLHAVIHHERIENIKDKKFDVITARALKSLSQLLSLSKPLMKQNTTALFLKGSKLNMELTESTKCWKFVSETFQSQSDHSGYVLKITNLEPKTGSKQHGRQSR